MGFENLEKNLKASCQGEKEKKEKALENFLENLAENLRKEGIPVKNDCRIDPTNFVEVYSPQEIERDKREIEELEKKFAAEERERKETKKWGKSGERALEIEEEEKIGEKLEILKTAVFSKFLAKDFIVARTSRYDDIKNKIDNVILDKKSGNLICAVDDVGETSGSIYEQKREKILEKNRRGGGKLKYGFKLEDGKLKLGKVSNIPIFLLVLPVRHIEMGIANFCPSFNEISDYEKKLYNFFISALDFQIRSLKLERDLNLELKNRIDQFAKILEELKGK